MFANAHVWTPADLAGIVDICKRWNITLVEDAAEALGSLYGGQHVGTIGSVGTLSFNGNKIITWVAVE